MSFLKKGIAILIGSLLLSLGINLFLYPNELLDGGMIGIGLIVNYLWGFETGLTIIICSIPIFIIAWFRYRTYFYNSIHGLLISSFFIDLLAPLRTVHLSNILQSPLVSSLIGGCLVGIGIGIMLKFETSTGGTDLLAQFISDLFSVNVGIAILIIDTIVVSLGGLLISHETLLLSLITIFVVGISTSLMTMRIIHY
ncbi:YitT family protein [Calidifontibacillus erzurumensis]|uniref:YitT family protein n=1 Tax=Calidifontibacillus erzurumensis TaxID=2741433 RepID=A0A8J8GF10_9BACI|nr:YitT family protein [Calidifontibacillus erzurumensis]NSL50623.1 YitT family protein [Calidifontibacillus erzurumensis]